MIGIVSWRRIRRMQARIVDLEKEISRLKLPIASPTQAPKPELPEIQQRILLMLAGVEFVAEDEITKRLGVGQHVADHHLEKLEAASMIWAEKATYGAPLCWQLMPPGRDYLIERGLLK